MYILGKPTTKIPFGVTVVVFMVILAIVQGVGFTTLQGQNQPVGFLFSQRNTATNVVEM